ncbi:MAG: hypothetical protein IIY21_03825 [Clostridiales bacterium]|nr:hypothetical protein [Clostridiales bacterium]
MTEKGCDNCYYSYFDEKAYPCSLCIRGIERTDMWQPSRKTKAQTEYDKYREKIRPHDPHKDWYEDEPQTDCGDEVEWVYNKRERLWYPYSNGELLFKTEPTISRMEQVDKDINVRSKDKPQITPNYCGTCKHREVPCGDLPCDVCHGYSNYEPKDEPQTERNSDA